MRVIYDIVRKNTDTLNGWYLRKSVIDEDGNMEETYKGPLESELEAKLWAIAHAKSYPFITQDVFHSSFFEGH